MPFSLSSYVQEGYLSMNCMDMAVVHFKWIDLLKSKAIIDAYAPLA